MGAPNAKLHHPGSPALWLYVLVGLIGGFLSGFAGIGGGVVLIPLMVGLLRISQHQAHGTSLAIIVPTALASVVLYFVAPAQGRPPPLDLALAYTLTAVVGAPIGVRLLTLINPRQLRKLFGVLLLSLALRLLTPPGYEPIGNGLLVLGLGTVVLGTLAIGRLGAGLRGAG